ncbi:MAG: prepilin-type N-terminal cleavage/methylation domain-containing protein [Armatimonadetes bacterium]|nr:prepilin-type N-terminal cleavage/methylation domain-containing protein [Armatimonadota bacterium]
MRQSALVRKGFTLAELAVAMAVLSMMGLALVLIYNQSLVTFRHSTAKVEMQQHAREASKRLVPFIASAVPPSTADDAIVEPAFNVTGSQLRIYSTDTYVARVTGGPATVFDPRNPQYARMRLWWEADPNADLSDPERAPGGQVGFLRLDRDTPLDPADDRIIARNIYSVEFENQGDHRIRVQVNIYGLVRVANTDELRRLEYENIVHMPYYTQPGGG